MRRSNAGFKLVEMLFAMGIFTLVMGTVLTLYVFSAKATQAASRQMDINNGVRAVNFMVKEIKSAQSVAVQTYNGTSFSDIPMGTPFHGNALALTVPSGANTLQVWYWVNSTGQLCRATLNSGNSKVFLSNVTNANPFAVQNYSGGVLSTNGPRTLVGIDLYVLDSNVKDFRQTLNLQAAAEKRN